VARRRSRRPRGPLAALVPSSEAVRPDRPPAVSARDDADAVVRVASDDIASSSSS
jgi:hypothetical protein